MNKNIGKVLNDRYELGEIIGIGGMAVVYKAYDRLIDRVVAVKILKEEFGVNDEFRKRFQNESRVIAMLSHINIVDVYDVNLEGDLQYIVMEHVDGITLKQYIDEKKKLNFPEALFFTEQILNALQHAHERGIVHRDIKPHNIMLLSDGTIKVADFGIARVSKFDTVTMTDKAIGSVHYISPEQASGGKTNEKSDIYSVGVMLYEMITGTLPFEGDTPVTVALMQVQAKAKMPSQIVEDMPRGLEQIIMKAISKNPDNRFTAAEMIEDIERFKKDTDIIFDYDVFVDDNPTNVVDVVKTNEKTQKKRFENLLPILLGVITSIIFFGVGIGILFFANRSETGNATGVTVPNFIGEVYESIANSDEYADFEIIEGNHEFSDKYDEGIVISQNPQENTLVNKGTQITLIISKGKKTAEIPAGLIGSSADSAAAILQGLGFKVEKKYESSNTVEFGMVTRTSPAESNIVVYGSTVYLYISSGQSADMATVPQVTGLIQYEAEERLDSAGFEYQIKEEYSNLLSKGYVISQTPSGNKQFDKKSTVIVITVSLGPEKATESEDISDSSSSEVSSSSSASGTSNTSSSVTSE